MELLLMGVALLAGLLIGIKISSISDRRVRRLFDHDVDEYER